MDTFSFTIGHVMFVIFTLDFWIRFKPAAQSEMAPMDDNDDDITIFIFILPQFPSSDAHLILCGYV